MKDFFDASCTLKGFVVLTLLFTLSLGAICRLLMLWSGALHHQAVLQLGCSSSAHLPLMDARIYINFFSCTSKG